MSQIDRRGEKPLLGIRSSKSDRVKADITIAQNLVPGGEFAGKLNDVRYGKAEIRTGVGTELITSTARVVAMGVSRLVRAAS